MPQAPAVTDHAPQVRRVTGRTVFLGFSALFAVMFAVNGFMIHKAIQTFSGVEAGNAYEKGLAHRQTTDAADAQDARGWAVSIGLTATAAQATQVSVEALDRAGRPVDGLTAKARLAHPTDVRRDLPLVLDQYGAGRYRGTVAAPAGAYSLIVEFTRGEERMFRSVNRVRVAAGGGGA